MRHLTCSACGKCVTTTEIGSEVMVRARLTCFQCLEAEESKCEKLKEENLLALAIAEKFADHRDELLAEIEMLKRTLSDASPSTH